MTTEHATNDSSELVEIEEKAAIPLELFFDLVFVFAITQVVSLIAHDLTWSGVFHGGLILALLWWAWTNWTWAANSTDLEPRIRRVLILAAMLGVFVIAYVVPTTFEGDGPWLAWGYVYVRLIATAMTYTATRADAMMRQTFWTYNLVSFAGTVTVIIGAQQGDNQQWWWLAAVVLEVLSTLFAGRGDWSIASAHFAERHGLIMIIALGESIIVVGSTLAGKPAGDVAVLLAVGLTGVCAMWWAYFDRLQLIWERALRKADVHETGHLARDVYSLLHYPMIGGIVLYAVALEEAFHEPDDPLTTEVGWILIAAIGMYLLSIAAATYRAQQEILWERAICVVVVAVMVRATELPANEIVIGTTAVLVITMAAEHLRFARRFQQGSWVSNWPSS